MCSQLGQKQRTTTLPRAFSSFLNLKLIGYYQALCNFLQPPKQTPRELHAAGLRQGLARGAARLGNTGTAAVPRDRLGKATSGAGRQGQGSQGCRKMELSLLWMQPT